VNLPFRFAAAAADAILDLTDEATNLVLAGILDSALTDAQKQRFGLLSQPMRPGWLTKVSVQADKTTTVTFGLYDKTAAAFYPVLPVQLVAAGSTAYQDSFESPGFALPMGGAVVPAIQVNVAAASVVLTGQIEVVPNEAERDVTPFNPGGFGLGPLGTAR